jgi:hypothetical protein
MYNYCLNLADRLDDIFLIVWGVHDAGSLVRRDGNQFIYIVKL